MRRYHLGKGTVLNILAEQSVKMRGQGIPDDRRNEAIKLYKAGLSLRQVADRLDCSAETVRQVLMASRVLLRAPWERGF
jgi:DNA-directed RNA polymerase specialized sigma24 family protein